MIRTKRTKFLRYKTLYVKGFFSSIKLTKYIDNATNYYPFATIVRIFALVFLGMNCKVVNGISISGNFDSRMEVETGGIKGLIGKLILKFLRLLDELKEKIK